MVKDMTEPQVIFEDNHVLVAVKPAGILSQADGSDAPDILNILKDYIKVKYDKPGNVYLGLLHRLDRNMEGIMVFAKTSKAAVTPTYAMSSSNCVMTSTGSDYIYYTTDGSNPKTSATATKGTVSSNTVTISAPASGTFIRAYAEKSGVLDSGISEYTVP
jgi:hypothetical protein